jgi:hypothetical protein
LRHFILCQSEKKFVSEKKKKKNELPSSKKTPKFCYLDSCKKCEKNVKKSKRGCVVTCDKDGAKPQ